MYSGIHLQEAAFLRSVHTALVPQGDGLHGWMISGWAVAKNISQSLLQNIALKFTQLTCSQVAARERVSLIPSITNTNGNMISDPAVSISAAEARAWINTFLSLAWFIRRTIWVKNAFWSTIWGRSNHVRKTRTVTAASVISGLGAVWSTWVRFTGVFHHNRRDCWKMHNCTFQPVSTWVNKITFTGTETMLIQTQSLLAESWGT